MWIANRICNLHLKSSDYLTTAYGRIIDRNEKGHAIIDLT